MRNTFLRVSKLKSDETSHHQPPPPPPLLPLPPPCRLLFHASTWIAPFTLDTVPTGTPYFLLTSFDETPQDIALNPMGSFSISEAQMSKDQTCIKVRYECAALLITMTHHYDCVC